jgi:LysR family transcriptional regulator for metE and metH
MIEIRHLRSLVAMAESKTLSVAAERVHLTQSALSHQLRGIEEHYGIALFERSRQGLRPTHAGERLIELARDVLGRLGDAERDLVRFKDIARGELRIALECHTCFEWLMPVTDEFRRRWPEVEVDLVAGFHPDPLTLLGSGKADIVVGSPPPQSARYATFPLFRFEVLLVLPVDHRLRAKRRVEASDLHGETLITYPVPPRRIDLIREVLEPAGVTLQRRTAELTVAIMQLVASRRGIAALPNWGVKSYIDHDYVIGKRIGRTGLWSSLYAVTQSAQAKKPYVQDFAAIVREKCGASLPGITLL